VQDVAASVECACAQRIACRAALEQLHSQLSVVPVADQVASSPLADDTLMVLSCGSADEVAAVLSALPQAPGAPIYETDPLTWDEAWSSIHGVEWRVSFQEELTSL
jgi:hypothetical protein